MNLTQPVTITPPAFTKTDGTVRTFNPITLNSLDLTIVDNVKGKSVMVQIRSVPRPLVLWKDKDYDDAGDYTQLMVENRVMELLGDEPSKVLESLFLPPVKK